MASKEVQRDVDETAMRFHREDMARRRLCLTNKGKGRKGRRKSWCGKGLTRLMDEKGHEHFTSIKKNKK